MIDGPFRGYLPTYTHWLIKIYTKLKLHPNHVTILGFLLSLISTMLVIYDYLILAIIFWWLGRIFDGTDGIYARESNQSTHFGAYLDIVTDMAAYSLFVMGMYIRFPEFSFYWFIIITFYVLAITSALTLGSLENELKIPKTDNRKLRIAAGLTEGGETGIAYTSFLLFPKLLYLTLLAWIVALGINFIFRTILAYRELSR